MFFSVACAQEEDSIEQRSRGQAGTRPVHKRVPRAWAAVQRVGPGSASGARDSWARLQQRLARQQARRVPRVLGPIEQQVGSSGTCARQQHHDFHPAAASSGARTRLSSSCGRPGPRAAGSEHTGEQRCIIVLLVVLVIRQVSSWIRSKSSYRFALDFVKYLLINYLMVLACFGRLFEKLIS